MSMMLETGETTISQRVLSSVTSTSITLSSTWGSWFSLPGLVISCSSAWTASSYLRKWSKILWYVWCSGLTSSSSLRVMVSLSSPFIGKSTTSTAAASAPAGITFWTGGGTFSTAGGPGGFLGWTREIINWINVHPSWDYRLPVLLGTNFPMLLPRPHSTYLRSGMALKSWASCSLLALITRMYSLRPKFCVGWITLEQDRM